MDGHPRFNHMYEKLSLHFCCPNMCNDVIRTIRNVRSCSKTPRSPHQHQPNHKLFQRSVVRDRVDPLSKTNSGNRFVLFIADRYTKLTNTSTLAKITAPVTADAFLTNLVYNFGIPGFRFTDNGSNFIAKFFHIICSSLGMQQLFTYSFHPHINSQAGNYNLTISIRLRHYVTELQRDLYRYIEPLIYGYNSQIHLPTIHTLFAQCLIRQPRNPFFLSPTSNTGSYIPISRLNPLIQRSYALCNNYREISLIWTPTFASSRPTTRRFSTRT